MTENLDISNESFNEDFCTHLEYHLGTTFEHSDREDIRGFWCDGVSWDIFPKSQLTKKNINDKRKLITKAWIGKNGQDEYIMTIQFGQISLSRYAKGSSLIDCIPPAETLDWIDIIPENKLIEIRLK